MKKFFLIMAVILPFTVLAQTKPRITSPSDRSNFVLGNEVNIYVSGNNIEVKYVGLNGNPNPSNTNESQNGFYTGFMYQSNNRFFFTPSTSTWENKWVKIVAHDKVGGGWSDPIYVQIKPKPQPNPTPPSQPQYSTSRINDYRWIIQSATVYSDLNLSNRKTTLNQGEKVYVSEKYTYSNGKVVAKINEGYVNANDLGTAEPTPTQQNVNEYRWINASTANVYNDLNLTSRKTTLNKGIKVYVSIKYILNNGTQVAKINEGYVNANDLGTAEPTPTQQNVNEYRWINVSTANVYNDLNLTSRKTTLNKGTKVYVSIKYILNNGTQVAKINEGYVNANDLGIAEPTPTQQNVNEYRWINVNTANVYNDLNLTSRKTTLSKGTKVYVSIKYILNNGTQVAKINEGYVNANDLGIAEPTPTQQNVNEYRWINVSTANIYNDLNLTSRKTTLNKGTKVYVSIKYILNNGTQVAKINEGYVNANDLGTAEPSNNSGNSSSNDKLSKYVQYDNKLVVNKLNPIVQEGNAPFNVASSGGILYVAETVGNSWEHKYYLFLTKEVASEIYIKTDGIDVSNLTKDIAVDLYKCYAVDIIEDLVKQIPIGIIFSLIETTINNLDKNKRAEFKTAVLTVINGNFICIEVVNKGTRFPTPTLNYKKCSSSFNLGTPYKRGWFFDMLQLKEDDINSLLNKGDVPRISSNGLYKYTELVAPQSITQQQTYNTSNFTKIGNAKMNNYSGRNYIGEINSTNGFRLSINSNNARTATFSIIYRSDNRGGKLLVNGVTQNINFTSTNWNWGTKEISGIQLRQGANTIEFYGGYSTEWAPDIAEITVK